MTEYAYYRWELGVVRIGCENGAVVSVQKAEEESSDSRPTALADLAFSQLKEYLAGHRREFTFPVEPKGTPFQQEVWAVLRRIPYGETRTYREIAEEIGRPKACRAVGMANHSNPCWIVIPCHRVIGSNGKLTGYAGGLEMKKMLLQLEAENRNSEE